MDSALGQSNGNTSSSSRSLRQRAARLFSDKVASPAMRGILPLPGLHELTSVAETLVDILRVDLPYEHDRWSTLALKIQYLIDIAVDMMELDPIGVQKLKCDLEETKIAFEGASSPRRLDFRKAKRHVQALEDLERKVDALIELAKMKLQVQLVFAHQDDGFKVIKAYEIRGQKILPPTHGKRKHQQRLISSGRQSVAACHHSGKFGRQPVVYVTYSSANVIDTEKRVRHELNVYSQCLHPNVASVMGVTRGPRLNGVVFVSAPLLYEEFLGQVSSPAALARCVRGFRACSAYFWNVRRGQSYPGAAHVQPDGHVIITPTNDILEEIELSPRCVLSIQGLDPAVRVAFQVLSVFQPGDAHSRFLDLMAQCPGPFTELKVLELADAANVLPTTFYLRLWTGHQSPPFLLQAGDVGTCDKDYRSNNFEWYTIGRSEAATIQNLAVSSLPLTPEEKEEDRQWSNCSDATSSTDGWRTYELHRFFEGTMLRSYVNEFLPYQPLDWKLLVAHWTRVASGLPNQIQLESICFCAHVAITILVKRRGSTPDNNTIYFHRCHSAHSDSQDFWGYFSSNIDPTSREDSLQNKGWTFSYELSVGIYRVVDGWGYKYKQLLKQSMNSMPGSFPGIETEDSSDGEDD